MTKPMSMTEAQAIILERLIEAMETDIALPIRVGPKAFGSSMPEYLHTAAENFAREREDWKETGGQRTAYERKIARAQLERRRNAQQSGLPGWRRRSAGSAAPSSTTKPDRFCSPMPRSRPAIGTGAATSTRETVATRRKRHGLNERCSGGLLNRCN